MNACHYSNASVSCHYVSVLHHMVCPGILIADLLHAPCQCAVISLDLCVKEGLGKENLKKTTHWLSAGARSEASEPSEWGRQA